MIKARSGNNLIFGLSEENIKRLKEGKPIKIEAEEMGLKGLGVILILYGRTEKDIVFELEAATGQSFTKQ